MSAAAKKNVHGADIEIRMPEKKFDKNGYVRCRVCGCTEVEPCEPPCGWSDGSLCTSCDATVEALIDWVEGARRPNRAALLRELKAQLLLRAAGFREGQS